MSSSPKIEHIPEKLADSSSNLRLDQALVRAGLVSGRARAKAEIEAGHVWCDGAQRRKASDLVPADARLELRDELFPWVSRAGCKLDHALTRFAVDATGKIALDVGASTGGFTQVLLARGAAKVYAVDVGQGQLHQILRDDPRVICLEKTDARTLTTATIPDPIDIVTCDASFISLKKILPAALALAAQGAWAVALVKPQFEAGRAALGKNGVVKSPEIHRQVCRDIEDWLSARPGWTVRGLTESPITGGDGNKEFIIAAQKTS